MPNGETYIGKWLENTENGHGVFIGADGIKEKREYKDGRVVHRNRM